MAISSFSICTIASAAGTSTIAKIVLAILLIQIQVPSLVSASGTFNKDECLACVESESESESCTYCKGSEAFEDKPSVCVCGDITGGFYGGCDDYTFGGDELTSNRDCQFGSSNGGSTLVRYLIVAAFAGVLSILLIIFVCCKRRQRGYGDKSNTIAGTTTTNTFAPSNGGGTGGFGIGVASGGMFGGPSTTTGASAYTSAATGTGTGTLFGGNNGFNDINASSGFGDGHGGDGGFGDIGI